MCVLGYVYTLQDELAFKQKQREDKKKLEEAKAKAGQKGPMGTSPPLMAAVINNNYHNNIVSLYRWRRNQEKRQKITVELLYNAPHNDIS